MAIPNFFFEKIIFIAKALKIPIKLLARILFVDTGLPINERIIISMVCDRVLTMLTGAKINRTAQPEGPDVYGYPAFDDEDIPKSGDVKVVHRIKD